MYHFQKYTKTFSALKIDFSETWPDKMWKQFNKE